MILFELIGLWCSNYNKDELSCPCKFRMTCYNFMSIEMKLVTLWQMLTREYIYIFIYIYIYILNCALYLQFSLKYDWAILVKVYSFPIIIHIICICVLLLWFGIDIFYQYPSGLFHCHRDNNVIVPMSVKQPWDYRHTNHKYLFPDSKVHPVGPRWAPCWPHEPRYQGYDNKRHTESADLLLQGCSLTPYGT